MQKKYEEFQNYNFSRSDDWQQYFDSLYPKPAYKQLQKFKRKWYRNNIDKDFDITYEPQGQENQKEQEPAPRQQQQQQGPQPNIMDMAEQQFHQIRVQTENVPLNLFSHIKAVLLIAYAVLFPMRYNVGTLVLAGVLLDMLRKFGPPKCNRVYFSHVAMDDDLHSLTLILFTNFVHNLIFTIPIYFFIFQSIVAYLFKLYASNEQAPLRGLLKPHVDKFFFKRGDIRGLRAQIEIYSGIYLIIGIFLGNAGLFQVLIYWQFLRMLYMVNGYTKWAFGRLSKSMDKVASHPSCPGIVRTIIEKIKGAAAWMTKMEQGQGGAAAGGGGPRCAIF